MKYERKINKNYWKNDMYGYIFRNHLQFLSFRQYRHMK